MLPSRCSASSSFSSSFARQLSSRLTLQPSSARILVSRALVASHAINGGSSSAYSTNTTRQPSQLQPQHRRCQSSHALTSAASPTTTTRSNSSSNNNSNDNVKPWLRQYRPQVNGRSVAFHVSDLLKQSPSLQSQVPSSSSCTTSTSTRNEFRPAQARQYESDLVVILDMDECMIHSQFLSSPSNAQVYAHQLQARQRHNNSMNGSNDVVDHFRVHLPSTGDLVHVNVRPGLRDFLQKVSSKFETHVFTAAMPVYAQPVLEHLDPNGEMFSQIWYREHCRYDAQHNAYLKDLEALPLPNNNKQNQSSSLNARRTVLIDNNPLSFITHPENGILVSSFYNDAQDNTLPAVFDLLLELESCPDVRPVLDARFGLKSALLLQSQSSQSQQQAQKKTTATTKTTMASTATASTTSTTTVPLSLVQQQQQASIVHQAVAAF